MEDEQPIADFVTRALEAAGHRVDVALDGESGQRRALETGIELVILDRKLPGRDGIEVLRAIRDSKPALPVIMLTALGEVQDRVSGLDAGATDYMTKPFSVEELLARVRAHLRSPAVQSDPTTLEAAGMHVDLLSREVTRRGRVVAAVREGVRAPGLPDASSQPGPLQGAAPQRSLGLRLRATDECRGGLRGLPATQAVDTRRSAAPGHDPVGRIPPHRPVKWPGGLRPRLTLLVAGVVALSLAAAFAVVYARTSAQLDARTEQDLREDMDQLRAAVLPGPREGALRRARAYLDRVPFRPTSRLLFVAESGRPPVTNQPELLEPREMTTDSAHERRETQEAARRFWAAPLGISTQSIPDAGEFRLLTETARRGPPTLRLGVGAPEEPSDQARDDILDAFLLAGGVGLLGALLGGFLVASRVATPLRRMAGVATRVDEGDLGTRMGQEGHRDEVQILAHSFDHMLDRLQDAFDRQATFIADASHELRTPLTVIRGQLEVLGMQAQPPAEEVRRVEGVVRVEVDRMARLVDDLLVLAHSGEEGFLRRRPIDMGPFLTEVVNGVRPLANRRFILKDVPPLVLLADPDRLAQALRNLILNAVAHTADGGLVEIQCARRDDAVLLAVSDDGPGIPKEARQAVLDRFHRLDHGRGQITAGAGLGLSIVQAIALAHGGDIAVTDSAAGGARVEIRIPDDAEAP